jgi:hypothetical protein
MLTVLLLLSCTTITATSVTVCNLELTSLSPSEATVGDTVVLTGGPTTERYDTLVTVGGTTAPITDIIRTGCESCDTCRSVNSCLACGDCDNCDQLCASECVESVTFTLPPVDPGLQSVQLLNAYGVSAAATLTVLSPGSDTGAGEDTGGGKDSGSGGADSGG